MKLDNVFLSASAIKEADGRASSCGISTFTLMGNAAKRMYECITEAGYSLERVAIICGRGGNGGDGYALACLMLEDRVNVRVIYVTASKNADAAEYARLYTERGGSIARYADEPDDVASFITDATLVVDALHGVAFAGELRGDELALVDLANGTKGYIVSADTPTGVCADGRVSPNFIIADMTVTFTANKAATITTPGLDYCGKVTVADIGVPEEAVRSVSPMGCIIDAGILDYLPGRYANSNKGSYGTLLAMVGSPDMPGAAYLASMGALRSGLGLLKLTSDAETLSVLKNRLSEPVFLPMETTDFSEQKYTAFLVGCGIGRHADMRLAEFLTKQKQITIIDADGINYLASHINVLMEMQGDVILTPHPGEMARLIGKDTEYVCSNRLECARAFAMEYCCVLVLKGDHTVIASPNGDIFVNTTGNSSLSKGGSGDVLAGVIASLAAQGVTPLKAACIGVYAHGLAADRLCGQYGVRGLLPHDLPAEIGRILG